LISSIFVLPEVAWCEVAYWKQLPHAEQNKDGIFVHDLILYGRSIRLRIPGAK
jgi:hypothetical protein